MSFMPLEILMVEDSLSDIHLTREALKDAKIANHLHVVRDGSEALNFLYKRGDFVEVPRPDIILLDLHLRKVDGREFLAQIKADVDLRNIPVVILTSSGTEEDFLRSCELNASCYAAKPVDLERLVKIVKAIDQFWIVIVSAPEKQNDRRAPLPTKDFHRERSVVH